MKKLLILFLFCAPAFLNVFAQNPTEENNAARALWLKGFEIYERAESSEKSGDNSGALTLYQESVACFQKVKTQYPKWNAALVEYRIKLCEKRVLALKQELQKMGKSAVENDKEKEARILKEKLSYSEKLLKDTQSRLETTLNSLAEARKEAAQGLKSQEEVGAILKEKSELEKRCSLFADEIKRLQQEKEGKTDNKALSERLEAERGAASKLREENASLLKKQGELEEQLRKNAAEKTELDYKLKKVNDALKTYDEKMSASSKAVSELGDKIRSLEKINGSHEEEMSSLQEKLEKEKKAASALEKRIKEFAENPDASVIARQLQSDNEGLKKELDALQSKYDSANKEKTKIENEKKEISAKLAKVETMLVEIGERYKSASDELEILRKKRGEFDAATGEMQKNINDLSGENKALKSEVESLGTKLGKYKNKDREYADLTNHCISVDAQNTKFKESLAAAKEEISKLKEQMAESERFKEEKEEELAKLVKSKEELSKCALKLEAVEAEAEKYKESAGKYQELERNAAELKKNNEALLNSEKELKKKNETLNEELSKTQKLVSERNDEVKKIRQALGESADKNKLVDELEQKLRKSGEEKAKLVAELNGAGKRIEDAKLIAEEKDGLLKKIGEKDAEIEKLKMNQPKPQAFAEAAPKLGSEEIKLLLSSAKTAKREGNKEAAIWHYEKVLSEQPDNLEALSRLGDICSEKGDDNNAIKYLEKALYYDPENVQHLLTCAYAYERKGDYYRALGMLGRAAAQDTRNPELQRYLGIACSNLGWFQSAEKQFLLSFELDSSSSETAFNLAVLYATAEPRKMGEAGKWYDKAKKLGAETDPGMEELFNPK